MLRRVLPVYTRQKYTHIRVIAGTERRALPQHSARSLSPLTYLPV